jgi:hypothetical protein
MCAFLASKRLHGCLQTKGLNEGYMNLVAGIMHQLNPKAHVDIKNGRLKADD